MACLCTACIHGAAATKELLLLFQAGNEAFVWVAGPSLQLNYKLRL
jgi:hypothetical protein